MGKRKDCRREVKRSLKAARKAAKRSPWASEAEWDGALIGRAAVRAAALRDRCENCRKCPNMPP